MSVRRTQAAVKHQREDASRLQSILWIDDQTSEEDATVGLLELEGFGDAQLVGNGCQET
jgi:hypothetical protein